MQTEDRWPEGAIVYQVYPRSLQDGNGDGIGDLPGVLKRLDYLQSLHVNAIWLSPFYPSPMADFGYDVADYRDVDPRFGTLADFDALLAACHAKDIKVMIDLVPNHTSTEHAWFRQSRQSRDNPCSDWYVWKDAKGYADLGQPIAPNNWRDALTGGPAWQWDEGRRQFYLHSFDVKQPDLNWSNPAVREAMCDVMRFWLDRGVDGFRVDAVYWLGKEPLLMDDTPNPDYVEGSMPRSEALLGDNSRGWPQMYSYLSEMARVLEEPAYRDRLRFMVTEGYPEGHNPVAAYLGFYVGVNPRVAAPFNFEGIHLPWEAKPWRRFLRSFHTALEQLNPWCVASYAFGNHDRHRLIDRLGSEVAARSAAVLLLTLPGMVFIYYGDEIGMHDVAVPENMIQDPAAQNDPAHGSGRDPERTPMQWSAALQAGFTDGLAPWLPVAEDYKTHNVEVEAADPQSFLSLYRRLGALRSDSEALRHGRLQVIDVSNPDILAFVRRTPDDSEAYLTLINFSAAPQTVNVPLPVQTVVLSSVEYPAPATMEALRPHEAAVLKVALPAATGK